MLSAAACPQPLESWVKILGALPEFTGIENAELLPTAVVTTTFALADPRTPLGTYALICSEETYSSGAAIPLNATAVPPSWVVSGSAFAVAV